MKNNLAPNHIYWGLISIHLNCYVNELELQSRVQNEFSQRG